MRHKRFLFSFEEQKQNIPKIFTSTTNRADPLFIDIKIQYDDDDTVHHTDLINQNGKGYLEGKIWVLYT